VSLRTTFGLLVSGDGARSFHWVCEDAMFYPDALASAQIIDPPVEVGASGRVVFGHPAGVRTMTTGCDITDCPGAEGRNVVDLAADPAGTTIFAAQYDPSTETSTILRGTESALAFVPVGPALARTEVFTLDVAPSRPARLYLSGVAVGSRSPVLLRSDDGGAQWMAAAQGANLGDGAYVSGVSPVDADTVFVRVSDSFGGALLRSTDGALGFTVVARSADPMTGFAISDDGRRVWYGSVNGGLFRSDDGGEVFVQVQSLPVLGMRFHAGVLWVISDWQTVFALGSSTDGGSTFTPRLRFEDIVGPPVCAPVTPGSAACASAWPQQQRALAPLRPDGGPPRDAAPLDATAPPDDGAVFVDATTDRGVPQDAPAAQPPADCGCAVPGRGRSRGEGALVIVGALGAALWWRRRWLQHDCR